MPLFKYKASNKAGEISEVLIEGDSQQDSLSRLRQRGLMPLESFGQVSTITVKKSGFKFWRGGSFDAGSFTNRLVPLLKAHVPLERALGIIAEGMEKDTVEQFIVNDLRRGLHEGKKLSWLVREHGRYFPQMYANLIEAGEETGSMTDVVVQLQRFLNDRKEMREFLITSSIYPLIILGVTFGVVILLFTVFIPRFSKIFMDMGKPLPLPTAVMLSVSNFVNGFWWLWLLMIAGMVIFFITVRKNENAAEWWDVNVLKIPVIGGIINTMEVSRFVRTLAVMTQNYVHLLNSVSISTKVIQNRRIIKSLGNVIAELKGGEKLSKALAQSSFIPKIVTQLLGIGEESGNLGGMLSEAAENMEGALKLKIRRMLALFEPVVIIFLAIVVLTVVISIFLAILEMNEI